MHSNKPSIPHQFSQSVHAAQEVIPVGWNGTVSNRDVHKADTYCRAFLQFSIQTKFLSFFFSQHGDENVDSFA
jgi:hypothetical protein